MNSTERLTASEKGTPPQTDVVEIGLLLPQAWAQALVELSRRRNQTVGHLLRSLIDNELRVSLPNP